MLLTDRNAGPVTAGGMAQAKYSNTSSHSLFSHTHRPGRCFVTPCDPENRHFSVKKRLLGVDR
jgi:hypothetical protein